MISVTNVTKRYKDRGAVHDLTFAVLPGRATGFVGPNGAGKSTTIRMMVGLTRPHHGEVRCHGVPDAELHRPSRLVGTVLDTRWCQLLTVPRDECRNLEKALDPLVEEKG